MAMRMVTATPYLDEIIAFAEGIVWDAQEALSQACPADSKTVTGWCENCTELQARVNEMQPVLNQLYTAGSDAEARGIAAGAGLFLAAGTGMAA